MTPSISLRTLTLASLGSAAAFLIVTRSGLTGTLIGAALVPVVITLVTTLGGPVAEHLARRTRRGESEAAPAPAEGEGVDAPPPGRWERAAAAGAVAVACVAMVVAVADGAISKEPTRSVVIHQVETPAAAASAPVLRTVTVVQRVEIPAEDPSPGEPARAPRDGRDGAERGANQPAQGGETAGPAPSPTRTATAPEAANPPAQTAAPDSTQPGAAPDGAVAPSPDQPPADGGTVTKERQTALVA